MSGVQLKKKNKPTKNQKTLLVLCGIWSLGFFHTLLKLLMNLNLLYFKRQSWVWIPLEKRREESGI